MNLALNLSNIGKRIWEAKEVLSEEVVFSADPKWWCSGPKQVPLGQSMDSQWQKYKGPEANMFEGQKRLVRLESTEWGAQEIDEVGKAGRVHFFR